MMTSWMLFIGILFLASNIASGLLTETMFAKFFFMLFQICFGLTPIIVIVWLIWIIVSMFHDKQFQALLNRGFFPGGQM